MTRISSNVPLLPDFREYTNLLQEIWNSGKLSNNGPFVRRFESDLKNYLRADNLSLFVNGHSALCLALKALRLQGEVITTTFTFASTIHAIVMSGLTPVFADIDENSFTLDAVKVEPLITDKTCAILGVHIFGHPCDVEAIDRIAQKYGLYVIYDAAQAFGTKIKSAQRHIGSFGDISMFSLHANKVLNSIEGGILLWRDSALSGYFEAARNFGINYHAGGMSVDIPGVNAKMNEFQAAMGMLNLRKVDAEINARKRLALEYISSLREIPGITTMSYRNDIEYNYAYFPIIVDDDKYGHNRDELCEHLAVNGVETRKLYTELCHRYACYEGKYKADVPIAESISKRILDLPLYSTLSVDDISFIGNLVRKFGKK
ncbi:MAG: DegT/DnrJ/EryC1/StrS family aminotransferase [Prevotellaceae bacterium]|jgi:dTDP-4-amino-4,6-dideoxygalactose transaminase|nr:DegT/DnrJ/EryC1/StrS family aminotransferase [Prevotellaceae bacterium]